MKIIMTILDRITGSFMAIGGLAVVFMMIHINLDIIGKTFFAYPIPATLEIVASYYMIIIVFLPLAAVEKYNGHICVELLSLRMPKRAQEILISVTSLVGAVYFGALTFRTGKIALEKYQVQEYIESGTSKVIMWPTRFILTFGCAILCLLLIQKAWSLIRGDSSVLNKPEEIRFEE